MGAFVEGFAEEDIDLPRGSADGGTGVPGLPGEDLAVASQLGQQASALEQGGGASESDPLGCWGMLGFSLVSLTLRSRGSGTLQVRGLVYPGVR